MGHTPDLKMPVDCSALTASGLPIVWVLGDLAVARELSVTRLWQSMATLTCPLEICLERRLPLAPVLDLLAEAMIKRLGGSKGFLIDGYPRDVAQGEEFEKAIAPCKHILYFEVSDDCMTGRLLKRAETSGRADDNVETIKKRLVTFHQHSEPVIAAYKAKCSVIPAERSVDKIFADVTAALDKM